MAHDNAPQPSPTSESQAATSHALDSGRLESKRLDSELLDSKASANSLESTPIQRNDKKGKTGLKRLYNAFFFSLDGIKAAWSEEEGFRQVFSIGIVLSILACFLAQSWVELILLILPCVLSIIAELINSAIENAIDFTSLELHPLAKKAKDMGSALQLIACSFVAFVWIGYLLMRFVL